MKKPALILSIFVVFALLAVVLGAKAQDSSKIAVLNGPSWNMQSDDAQFSFAVGFMMGFNRGVKLADSFKPPDSLSRGDRAFMRNRPRMNLSVVPSNREVTDEITLFYKDFRNAPVCWGDAVLIAHLALGGNAPPEAELDAVRSEDTDKGCRIG